MAATRTIGRLTTNAMPSWATYTETLTLRQFGSGPNAALQASVVWPGGSPVPNLDGGSDGSYWAQHLGWGSTWYLQDVGVHGAFAHRRTGEFAQETQMSLLPLSADSPTWQWWQQPYCCLSLAQAVAEDADFYFNVDDYNALPANRRIGTAEWNAGLWDLTFPVGLPTTNGGPGWIVRRKVREGSYGKPYGDDPGGITTRARYDAHCTIPASWTGTGSAAIVINPQTLGGPFQNWQGQPSIVTKPQWFETVGASGEKRSFLCFQAVGTKRWSFAPVAIPDFQNTLGAPAGPVFRDLRRKRLYWVVQTGTSFAFWWADFSNGIAGMTVGGPVAFSGPTGFNISDAFAAGCTEGHPDDRKLMYLIGNEAGFPNFYVFDFDAGSLTRLDMAGKINWATPYPNVRGAMTYLPDTNTMVILERAPTAPLYYVHRSVVPASPLVAANYAPFQRDELAVAAGTTLNTGLTMWYFGERFISIPTLRDAAGRHLFAFAQDSLPPLTFRLSP